MTNYIDHELDEQFNDKRSCKWCGDHISKSLTKNLNARGECYYCEADAQDLGR